jgi:transcriptional regulator GlxA family with amidase domain
LGVRPLHYLQDLRIEAAKQLLENSDMQIDEILYEVGYEDLSSFSRLFQQRTGLTPSGYRKRFKVY